LSITALLGNLSGAPKLPISRPYQHVRVTTVSICLCGLAEPILCPHQLIFDIQIISANLGDKVITIHSGKLYFRLHNPMNRASGKDRTNKRPGELGFKPPGLWMVAVSLN
jgi:hypothetical protein